MNNATLFLSQKVAETIGEYGVPALAAAVVSDKGAKTAAAQGGIRKVGGSGSQNEIKPEDQFSLGSVTKVVTGYLMTKLIEDSTAGFTWETTIGSVFPELASLPKWKSAYGNATIQHLLSHTAGFPYSPSTDDLEDYQSWTSADLTDDKVKRRRMKYVKAAVIDPPLYDLGAGLIYDGGGIICAAMAEQKTGQTYEQLVRNKIFSPLGMNNADFGRTSKGSNSGAWQHIWDASDLKVKPDQVTMYIGNDGHPRTPVGGVTMSAKDMLLFLKEQVTDNPKVCNISTRETAQTREITASFARGGWGMSTTNVKQISHNGDNGRCHASATVNLDTKSAYAAMCNMNNIFAGPAVSEMNQVSQFMINNWAIFEDDKQSFIGCVHPCPAIAVGGRKEAVFARKHDGSVWVKRSADGGEKWTVFKRIPDFVATSGIAAAMSNDGNVLHAFGRGVNNSIWRHSSTDGGATWPVWWQLSTGDFMTGPAAAASADGSTITVVAVAYDNRMYWSRSTNAGDSWSAFVAIGQGVFTSAPAIAMSDDGQVVHVFGRGNDWRIWRNRSGDGGRTWQSHWQPIGQGIATSSPAAAASGDGKVVHVVSRGCDTNMWRNASRDSGSSWLPNWRQIEAGGFTSAPAIAANGSANSVRLVGLWADFRPNRIISENGGDDWNDWKVLGTGSDFFI